MQILLTGSNGFTGNHFRAIAEEAGHMVRPLISDLADKDAVSKEIARCEPDAVVHLAAISFVGHADEAAFYAVNVVGSMNLLAALAALPKKPRRVLMASSANVYGNCTTSPISEEQPPAPVNHYAASKLAMEHMARTYSETLPITIARPFNYTGPGQSLSFLIPKIVDHYVRVAPVIELGNLHVEREFNDVRMVCETYLQLLKLGIPGETYNVCTGITHTLQSVLDTMTEHTGHKPTIKVNPSFVRSNEVHRLCGDPTRLLACTGKLQSYALKDTLLEMMGNASEKNAAL